MFSECVDAASLRGPSTRQPTGVLPDSFVKSTRYLLLNVDSRVVATAQRRIANPGHLALQREAVVLDPTDTMPASVQAQGCEVVVRETCGGTARATTHMTRKRHPPTNST